MAPDDGGAAFGFSTIPDPDDDTKVKPAGMTLRDWFAGQAMCGLYAANGQNLRGSEGDLKSDARIVYRIADAMLAERSK